MLELTIEPREEIKTTPPAKPRENLKQRAYLNGLTSMLDFIAVQITGILVSPVIVKGLGASIYGVWKVIGQLTGYATLADARATQVLKWTVAQKKDTATDEELRSDAASALYVTVFILPFILLAGAVLSWYAPYITGADVQYHSLVRITCSILILSLVISKIFDLYEAVLRGMNLGYKRMGLRSVIVIGGGGLKVLAITEGYGLIGLAVVQVVITIITGLSFWLIVKRTVGWFGFGHTNFRKVLSFGKLSGWNMANTTTDTILTSSDKVLLGLVAGPVAVSTYSLTTFLPLAVQGFLFRIIIGAVPGIGKLFGLKEYAKIQKVWNSMNGLIFLLTTAAGVTIILFNNSFLNLWVGKSFFAGNVTNILLIIMILQDTLIKHDGYIINATLDLKRKVYLTLIASGLFISSGYLLISKFGIEGLCVSLIAGKFMLFVGQRKLLRSKMEYHEDRMSLLQAQPIAISIAMLFGALYLTNFLPLMNLVTLLTMAPLVFIFSFGIYFFLGLTAAQRSELIKIISTIKFFKSN